MRVHINPDMPSISRQISSNSSPVVVDVETDERDNMVGIGYTQNGTDFYYCTGITDELKQLFEKVYLIGHNLKFDAHMLKKWGFNITSDKMLEDTMLMSYCKYGSSRSHSLKSLAKDLLNMEWTTYDQLTTKIETKVNKRGVVKEKKTKLTLDLLPVEEVADYCCHDVKATSDLLRYFYIDRHEGWFKIYQEIELPVLQVLYDMEERGILLDVPKLTELDSFVKNRIFELLTKCEDYAPGINIGSSKQLAPVLEEMGYWLPTTPKGNKSTKRSVLERYAGEPFIDRLLEYSTLKKLGTSFTKPLAELDSLPRVYPTFNQVRNDKEELAGISTGRLSCSNPNLQQIPSRSKLAKKVRDLFIPDSGKILVCADYSQIEPRILSHISKDRYLQDVFNTNRDMYTALIKGTPWENKADGRNIGKTFYLALSYGAQAKKLSKVFKCSVDEAQRLLNQCWENIPKVKEWQTRTIVEAREKGYVETLFGRRRYLPELASSDFFVRAAAERRAINTPIQGTAADIMKLAMKRLHESGYPIQLVVHDEIVLSVDPDCVGLAVDDIKQIMENIIQLDVPLNVEIKSGGSWNEAKS